MGVHFGVNDPRSDTIYPDVGRTQLLCQGLGIGDDGTFSGGVGGLAGGPHLPPHGGHGDDGAGLSLQHVGEDGPAAVVDAVHIDGEQTPPLVFVDLTDEAQVRDPGGADQNVKLTKTF